MKKHFYWIISLGIVISGAVSNAQDNQSVPAATSQNFIGTPMSANAAADSAVNQQGVVVDLQNGDVATLPPVMYGQGTPLPVYSEGVMVSGGYSPESFSGKAINLSLSDAEVMAINYSWKLKQTITQKMQAQAKKYAAIGGALPSPTFSTGWNANQSMNPGYPQAPSASNTWQLALGIRQPLFLGGRVISAIKEAYIYKDFISEDIRRVRLATVYAVRNQYYLALRYKHHMAIYKEQMEVAKEYWEKTKRRYEADDVPEIDVLRYEVDYKVQEAYYIQASSNYNIAISDLMRLIGLPLDTETTLVNDLQFTDFDPGNKHSLMSEALTSRPEIKQAELQEKMQEEQIKQAKSGLFPEVYASGNWSNSNNYYHALERRGDAWNWSSGIELSWDALAGGGQTIRASIMTAKAILDSYKFETRDTVDQVKQEVNDSLLSLYSAIDWVKSQKENVEQATRVLKQQTIRWDEGAGDYLEILDARNTLANTQMLYWDGMYSYATSIVNLEYSIGRFSTSVDSDVKGYKVTNTKAKTNNTKPQPKAKSLEECFNELGKSAIDKPNPSRQITVPATIGVNEQNSSPVAAETINNESATENIPQGPQSIYF